MIEELKPCPEIVEKVARAISEAAYDNMRAQGFSGGWDHDELGRAIAGAAIIAYDPDKRLREALEPLVRNAYEEGVDDGVSWHSYPESGPRPGWIDSVARIELFRLDAALSHNGG